MFSAYFSKQEYHPIWKQIIVKNTREKFGWPAKRGGHQLCADYINSKYRTLLKASCILRSCIHFSYLYV